MIEQPRLAMTCTTLTFRRAPSEIEAAFFKANGKPRYLKRPICVAVFDLAPQ
jgi:hypothetical protein